MATFRQLTFLVGFALSHLGAAQDEAVLNAEIGRLNNDSLLWDLRFTCEQHQGMAGYGWDEYDTRNGGVQTIHDAGNGIDITTSFVKVPGGGNGGSWAARIKGVPRSGIPDDVKTQVLLYVSQEGLGSELGVLPDSDGADNGFAHDVTLIGKSEQLGRFKLAVTEGTGEHPQDASDIDENRDFTKTVVQSLVVPPEFLWQGKSIALRQFSEQISAKVDQGFINKEAPPPVHHTYALPNRPGAGNAHLIQKIFEGPFEFDILFSSESAGKELTSEDLTREVRGTTESFGERFTSVFTPQAPFTADKYLKFGKSMFSNLIGGIGYFYGQHVTDRSYAPEYEEDDEGFWEAAAEARARKQQSLEGPYELFTSIPSRPFFPRGFLWDEGFHLLPIADWDIDLTLEIIKSWYNLMDDDGWIAREQILGDEARSKVPEEFQVQYPHYANPPTLFIVIDDFIARLKKVANGTASKRETLSTDASLGTANLDNPNVGLDYLRQLYPLLRRQLFWFKKTQSGDITSYDRDAYSSKEAYRWRGRTPRHILTSGLDDYPRPQPPHPAELHVDLISWVGLMTKSLVNIAETIGLPEDVEEYKKILDAIEHNIDDLHWSEKEGCYCDATIDDYEENELVCHKGYISLFPFLTGLLKPDSPKLGKLLDLIGDEEELWSPHGIRSLSKRSEFYGTDENYWRSPVWININYMAVTQLYAKAKDLYSRLRKNLVDTVYKSWVETGFAWEQYNPETGAGQRTQHFTGWTSLVVKIMAMPDLDGSGHVRDEL
ncbi:Processing alpha glucosidase I [Cytospora paraplurivora]|uniref:Mannosyl-oligosaccharide glucosidase n=1 Tax=Cytospora paraplurivora TaxID=2898453 RepID=A0AAN9UMM4_9PEZI